MAITLFGSASTPADNVSQAGPGPITVTPPASMAAGDVALVMITHRVASQNETLRENNAGGQEWYPLAWGSTTALSWALLACRFNGTWSANPTFEDTQGNAAPLTAKMDVFRPTSGSLVLDIDWSPPATAGTFTAGSTPFTKTITGITTRNAGAVAIAYWMSVDDNTWGSLTAGWSNAGGAQIRNASGSQMSTSVAYQVFAVDGATGNVSQNQATNGGDTGATCILSLYERAADFSSVPACDVFWDGEDSTDGTALTATILNNGTHLNGTPGTWDAATGAGGPNLAVETSAQQGFGTKSVTVNGTSYTDSSGTRGVRQDHGAQNANAYYHTWTKSSSVAVASAGGWYRTAIPYGFFFSHTQMGMQNSAFSSGVFLSLQNYESARHRCYLENTSSDIILAPWILKDVWYWVTFKHDATNNIARLIIYNADFTQRGFGCVWQLTSGGATNFNQFNLGSFGGNYPGSADGYTGIFTDYDDVILEFTGVFPLGPATAAAGGSTAKILALLGVG